MEAVIDEYPVQFFGFSAKAFSDSVYNLMCESVDAHIEDLYRELQASTSLNPQRPDVLSGSTEDDAKDGAAVAVPSNDDQSLAELRRGCENIRANVLSLTNVTCDKLEMYVTNHVFIVPEHVTLPEDRVHLREDIQRLSHASVDAELAKLEDEMRLVASRIAEQELDKKRVDSTLKAFESRLNLLERMSTVITESGVVDLEASVKESVIAAKDLLAMVSKTEK